MVDIAELLTDLAAESDDLDRTVAPLSDVDLSRPTPSPGWTIAHQIAHLTWTDRVARLSIVDTDAFAEVLAEAFEDPTTFVDRGAVQGLAPPPELLSRWRTGRAALAEAIAGMPTDTRAPWFGTAMSAPSIATGRLMETWAHGQDVADALGVVRRPTGRLRHIAYLGYRTLGHSFAVHGRRPPEDEVYVALEAPDRTQWTFGPPDAGNRVAGPALDFCLLVTQRRNRADLALQATGPVADEWLDVAQAFAGPPGTGREPAGVST